MKKLRDYGITIGKLSPGPRNQITDISGVTVGHSTIKDGSIQTGVTVILPHQGDIYNKKVVGACHIINGYSKPKGAVQVQELGSIEAPILLTNSLSIGAVWDGIIDHMLENNEEIGTSAGAVNPVIAECNDSFLNDIRGRHVKRHHVSEALADGKEDFGEGNFGAGTGMTAFGLKGGIGSSSRVVEFDDRHYTIGSLVLTNFGRLEDLMIDGRKIGAWINEKQEEKDEEHPRDLQNQFSETKGSVVIVLATDAPLTDRQLERLSKRATVGLARTGAELAHKSGDLVIAFSTKNLITHAGTEVTETVERFEEDMLDRMFIGAIEAVEESVINSLITAEKTVGRDGHYRESLKDYIEDYLSQQQ